MPRVPSARCAILAALCSAVAPFLSESKKLQKANGTDAACDYDYTYMGTSCRDAQSKNYDLYGVPVMGELGANVRSTCETMCSQVPECIGYRILEVSSVKLKYCYVHTDNQVPTITYLSQWAAVGGKWAYVSTDGRHGTGPMADASGTPCDVEDGCCFQRSKPISVAIKKTEEGTQAFVENKDTKEDEVKNEDGNDDQGGGSSQADQKQATNPTATGDPHLVNIRGEKFDVHDGLHRLVHFPRGASESEALLIIDADASMMEGEQSCYNVYFTSARISGKWVGSDVLLQHDVAPMGQKQFMLGIHGKLHRWADLARDASHLRFSGTEPVKLNTRVHEAFADTPGGEDIDFSIGRQNPVQVQVWTSHGANVLTENQSVQYLNLEVHNLPEHSGGLLGKDTYTKPPGSKCGLTDKEHGAIDSLQDLALISLRTHSPRLHWHMSAHALK